MLIEREAELAALDALVTAAVAGRGGAALVEGEAGIGKTRLLEAARVSAEAAGARVLAAVADEIEAGVPLAAARVLLGRGARDVAPDGPARLALLALDGALAEPSGAGSRADEVVHALWWLIVELADARPLALFVDDAHWADDLTLALLRLVARRAADLPLALVVTARPAAPGQRHAALAAERALVRLEPAPLSDTGSARLAEALLGRPDARIAARARALTGGNPLYLTELLRSGDIEAPPAQLVRLVAARLERLTPSAAALARAIAILGADATPRRAHALAAAPALEAEDELRAERVLDAHAYAFAHPLLATATRAAIGAADAADLHARAAALLQADGADDARVAAHLLAAPPRGDAAVVAVLRRAADSARRVGAARAAARLLERALAEPPAPELADTLAFEHGRALLEAGEEDGERVLARVVGHAALPARADAARQLARHLALAGRSEEAFATLRAVTDRLEDSQRELRLELLAEAALALASVRGGRERALQTLAAEAQRVTGRTPAERLLTIAARVVAGEPPSDPAGAARRLLALRAHRDFPGGYAIGELTFGATMLLVNADALDEAERAMDVLRADAEAMALPNLVAGALWQQAQIAYQRGDVHRCELEARAAIEAGGELAIPWLALALTERGELAAAEAELGAAGLLDPIGPSGLLHAAVGSRGRLRLAQGDAEAAAEDLADARERSAAWFAPRVEPPWQPLLAEALVLAGRTAEAMAEADAYAALAPYWGTRRALGHLARMRALVAARGPAIALLEQAREHFAAAGARLELARCETDLGTHRRAAGDRRAARAILRDAHDAAHACGAFALCRRARDELALAGGRPRPPAGDALTPAERRVADIAATGLTNAEIARRLYLSPKTVEMHLRSAYRKLGVSGRGELPVQGQVQGPRP